MAEEEQKAVEERVAEEKKEDWIVLKVNGIITLIYSVLCSFSFFTGAKAGDVGGSISLCLMGHGVLCLFAFLIVIFINPNKGVQFLLYGLFGVVVGFSICTATFRI